MLHDVSWPMAGLVSLWCSAVLYGMNIILTGICVHILLKRKGAAQLHLQSTLLLLVVLTQFGLASTYAIISLVGGIQGFVQSSDPAGYFADSGQVTHLTESVVYLINIFMADGVLVWRLYIVWGRNRWICLPFASMIAGSITCGCVATGLLFHFNQHTHVSNLAYASLVLQWNIATWTLSIAVQFFATLLIVWKIWSTYSASPRSLNSTMLSVMWTVLESGMVLSATTILILIFYLLGMITLDIVVAIIGQLDTLVPTSMIVRGAMTAQPEFQSMQTISSLRTRKMWSRFGRTAQDIRSVDLTANATGPAAGEDDVIYELQGLKSPSMPETVLPAHMGSYLHTDYQL